MISTKTMIKDEFTKSNGLEYEEDCDMDVENDDESSVGGTNETKEESESTNDVGEEENDEGTASTSGNNLFLTQIFATQRHKPNREAKMLETSIANLKKKLQTQSQTNFSSTTTHPRLKRPATDTESASAVRGIEDLSQVTSRTALRVTSEGNPLEIENYSKDSFDEEGETAVERSLAAMTKSKYSTSSSNPFHDVDHDEDDERSKNDAFLDRIFGESKVDNKVSKNFDLYDVNESVQTSFNPAAYISKDMTLSAALRRRRQRRNPVWPYFMVKDGVATCKHCNYSTKSVFSTNLKVHLRTHHHDLFEEVLKAEEEQQEQITLQNSLLATRTTTSAATIKTPYMHHVTTTALPAVGKCSSSGSNAGSSIVNSNVLPTTGSNLSSAAVLLGILNQTGGFQSSPVVTTTTTATADIATVSNRTHTVPTTPRGILDFPKAFSESQLSLDYLKTTPDLTKNLPDFLKVISEASMKSAANAPLNQTKVFLTGDNERLKTFSKIAQNSPSSYNVNYASGKTDKIIPSAGSQSAIVLKRRRLRRHPVWRFFKDVGDGSKTVKCVNCPFSTSSPFSTNLKMHLKAHHKSDYRLILILESRQRLEEGISPIPESLQTPSSPSKKSSSEDTNISSAEEEQTEAKRRSLSTGNFEDESFTSMTNTERVKAMIEMAAASQTQAMELEYPNVDYGTTGDTNRTANFGPNEASNLVDTELLMRLGFAKSDLIPSKPPLQNKFLNTQSVVSGSTIRNHPVNVHVSASLDTTKSVRTISKRLPTGEVVKVRQTRKSVENPVTNITANTSAAATATINTTKPIVPSRDLTAIATTDEQFNAINSARDIALAKFLSRANAFQLLELPEFKQFVDVLDPTYQLPQSGYLKRLLEIKTGDHDLPSEYLLDIIQEQGE
ncbi:BED zinc finger family protein [Acanthocheilonema viteae]